LAPLFMLSWKVTSNHCPTNILFKYTDDTNLLVPENTDVSINLTTYYSWLQIVNRDKTKETVFHRPSVRYTALSFVTRIEQVVAAKLLNVRPTFCRNLKFDEHVNILIICY